MKKGISHKDKANDAQDLLDSVEITRTPEEQASKDITTICRQQKTKDGEATGVKSQKNFSIHSGSEGDSG